MKTKYFLLATGAILMIGGLWFARAAWRAHRQLVSLNVREAPLADVLHRIERQTWTKIRAEKSLAGARITLHVSSQSLRDVLNRIAEQAGAHWSTLYAIYDSAQALQSLDTTLAGNGKLEPAGWKRIAPDLSVSPETGGDGGGQVFGRNPNPGGSPMGGPRRMMLARRTKDGPVMVFGGPSGEVETWSPEELVLQSSLTSRLGTASHPAPTARAAAEAAKSVGGKWTTYLAFSKSSMGVGFRMPPDRPVPGQAFRAPDPNERFASLTPQQRVQRARQRLGIHEP